MAGVIIKVVSKWTAKGLMGGVIIEVVVYILRVKVCGLKAVSLVYNV